MLIYKGLQTQKSKVAELLPASEGPPPPAGLAPKESRADILVLFRVVSVQVKPLHPTGTRSDYDVTFFGGRQFIFRQWHTHFQVLQVALYSARIQVEFSAPCV